MPLGASRLSYLALPQVEPVAEGRPLTITAFGDAQVDTAQSKFGGASAYFDGNGDYLTCGNNGTFNFGADDFTIEGWVRLDGTNPDFDNFFGIWSNTNSLRTIFIGMDASNKAVVYFVNSGGTINTNILGTTTLTTGTWYHIAVVGDSSNITLYVNGTAEDSEARQTLQHATGNKFSVGADNGGTNPFNGWIDELRVSDSARYTGNFTPSTIPFVNDANTLLLIHADGTDGSTVFTDDNTIPPTRGTAEYAVDFDGSSDYIYMDNTDNLSTTNPYSVFFWFKADTLSTTQFIFEDFRNGIFAFKGTLGDGGSILRLDTDGPTNGNYALRFQSGTLSTGTWYAVFCSFNINNTSNRGAYIQQLGSSTVTQLSAWRNGTASYQSGFFNSARNLGIGGRGANGVVKFNGQLSDFWMTPTNVDFTSATNRQKFVTSSGYPVDLGSDGSTPFGTAPEIFISGPASNWSTNYGSLGNDPTIVGTLGDVDGPGA